ncbi:VWA domain-containing protein [Derxia gummosa]|uniref:VWA domain-containing protein n=1 Tax=Derxia gummosa DSM 723 TaxID=1121388 RepID=A0A8B6X5T3_9BURK|nr:VWA domain-containing protein [Derxia gummosa]
MGFLWPELLWALPLVPLAVLGYWLLLRRRKPTPLRVAQLDLIRAAAGRTPAWRRHLPPALLLLAFALLLLAGSRPTARVKLPLQQQTIILAMDVSGSMRAADVKPDRLTASQEAARTFVRELPRDIRIGVVSFAGTASVVQAPTLSRDDVLAAIDRFQLQRGTAIGSGIVLSLATLFPDAGIEIDEATGRDSDRGPGDKDRKPPPFTPVPPGSYSSAAVVLLTDGQTTTGVEPAEATKMAAERGVKIYTVGIGTKDGGTVEFDGWSLHARLDEDTLRHIADETRANYFYAGNAEDLRQVYSGLSSRIAFEVKETEITALLALAGGVLALLAGGLSVWWFGRVA